MNVVGWLLFTYFNMMASVGLLLWGILERQYYKRGLDGV